MPCFYSGPILRNILDRANLSPDERDKAERGMIEHFWGARQYFEKYSGPFKNIGMAARQKSETDLTNVGHTLFFETGRVPMVEAIDMRDESVLHGIHVHMAESLKSSLRGKPISEIIQYGNHMSEFWTGSESVEFIRSYENQGQAKEYIMFRAGGLRKRYFNR